MLSDSLDLSRRQLKILFRQTQQRFETAVDMFSILQRASSGVVKSVFSSTSASLLTLQDRLVVCSDFDGALIMKLDLVSLTFSWFNERTQKEISAKPRFSSILRKIIESPAVEILNSKAQISYFIGRNGKVCCKISTDVSSYCYTFMRQQPGSK